MSEKNQHIVPHSSGWAVRGAGNQRFTSVHVTQSEAISAARETAIRQGSEMLIQPAILASRFSSLSECGGGAHARQTGENPGR